MCKFSDAFQVSGASGKLNVITTGAGEKMDLKWKDKFNIVSGLIGGFFLSRLILTDQSRVGRYLYSEDNTESKLGLLMNGLVKCPCSFLSLLGALIFTYLSANSTSFSILRLMKRCMQQKIQLKT
jgi:hypothetical protein